MSEPIVIPAYQPGESLAELVDELLAKTDAPIVIVDDGSGSDFDACFERASRCGRVHLVRHAVNLGKGAALKTGMNYALVRFPEAVGVVTADADGQHRAQDIAAVGARLAQNPGALIMGVREFTEAVPWRSRMGNEVTRLLMRALVGYRLADTQTGLRGIPARLMPHLLRLRSWGYEFELDMLIACKHQGFQVLEQRIGTVYLEGNKSSHFHPIFDSMRIYFLLFRFSVLSLLTAVLDNIVFAVTLPATGSIGRSQIAGRLVAMIFNYAGARSVVFHSRQGDARILPKYVALVAVNGAVSYVLIQWLRGYLGVKTIAAKLVAEGFLFIANFAIQRDFVFTSRKAAAGATDWDSYYTSVPATARLTRRYTSAVLVDAIRRYAAPENRDAALSVVEIGGANSCFMDRILEETGCKCYDVVDTNRYGLELLRQRVAGRGVVHLHQKNVLALELERAADVVFSVGLVEHFDAQGTRAAVMAHFDMLRAGGTAIIAFPTPTLLYRVVRGLIEAAGMWKFPDERPLDPEEVMAAVRERADILFQKTLWPLMLTQRVIVARKRARP